MAIVSKLELQAIAQAAAQPSPDVAATLVFLAAQDAIDAQIAAVPADVKAERSAAALALIKQKADAEAVRAAFWSGAKLPARRVAVMAGGMPKERANDALSKFNAMERGTAFVAIERLIQDLEIIKRCMQGGEIPQHVGGVQ